MDNPPICVWCSCPIIHDIVHTSFDNVVFHRLCYKEYSNVLNDDDKLDAINLTKEYSEYNECEAPACDY